MRLGTTTRYDRNRPSQEDYTLGRRISADAYKHKVSLEGTYEERKKDLKKRDMLTAALSIIEQSKKDEAAGKRTAATIEGNLEGQRLSNKGKYAIAQLDTPLTEAKANYYNNEARVSGFKGDDAKISLKYSDAFYKKASTGAPVAVPINTIPPKNDQLTGGGNDDRIGELLKKKKYSKENLQDDLDYSDATFS